MAISTETIILKVEGQTDGAVRATERLTQAQQKLNDAFRSAVGGADDMMGRLGEAIRSPVSATGKLGDALRSLGFDAQTFAGGLKDIGKGLTFDLIRGGIKNLGKDLDSTSKAALSAAVSGASMGAAFGGPLGAAIGGVAGSIKGLVESALDADEAFNRSTLAAQEQGKAYWEAIHSAERKKQIEQELAQVTAQLAEQDRIQAERASIVARATNEASDAYRNAVDAAGAYADVLYGVNHAIRDLLTLQGKLPKAVYQSDPLGGGGESSDEATAVRASRGKRDADTAAYAATKSYGATLMSLERAENARNDRMRDLEMILGDINVPEKIRNEAIKEYNAESDKAKAKMAALAEQSRAVEEANMKAWAPVIAALKSEGVNNDPWASVRLIEARAKAITEHEMAVEEKAAQWDRVAEPDLEDDMRVFNAVEKAKEDAEALKSARKTSYLESVFGSVEEIDMYREGFEALGGTFSAFGDAVGASYEAIVSGQGSASKAFKAAMADGLLALGKSSAVEALRETALGFGSLALGPLGGASASMHFKAAALHGAVAVVAGGAARALGTGGGASAGGSGASAGGGSGAGPRDPRGGATGQGNDERPRESRPVYVIVGEHFSEESPRARRQKADAAVERALRERDE